MTEDQPFGFVLLDPDGPDTTSLPLMDRIFVGRECAGVDDSRRIILGEDLAVSRNHLEIRVEPESLGAVVVDMSSNGTRVNGIRIERSVAVPLNGGDRIQVGSHVLEFRGETLVTRGNHRETVGTVYSSDTTTMAMVVGDLINFSTVSEQADQKVLAHDVDRLYRGLRDLLTRHKGTLVDYVGDAFFASWELDANPAAVDDAVAFVLAASDRVSELTADFDLRYADGTPLRMGWALTMGSVVVSLMPGSVVMMLGDAVNVGFRISGIAGRDGRPTILATHAIRDAAKQLFGFGEPETVPVKGRIGTETIYGVFRADTT